MHQMALEISETYIDLTPKARLSEPNWVPRRALPVMQPTPNQQVTEVFMLDQFGNPLSQQLILQQNGSTLFPPRNRN